MSVVNWREEVTSGCQSLDPRLPGSRASVCVCVWGFSLGLVPLPSPPVPVTLKHWREKAAIGCSPQKPQ